MISAKNLKIGYEQKVVIEDLSLEIEKGEVLSIIGPNGCGKSTLLKTLSRLIKPIDGEVLIEGKSITSMKSKEISKKICLLSQHNNAPADLTVEELVYFGRIPHKKWFETKTAKDKELVDWAIENTGLTRYKDTKIGSLSGGERQRAYIAQALCQQPEVLLLDEPTTFLDISYQLELMELVREINEKFDITIVMVLHELNQASKYSDRLVIMKGGEIVCKGCPYKIVNKDIIKKVYCIDCDIDKDPVTNKPRIHPIQTLKNASNS